MQFARAVSDVNSVNLFLTQPKHIDFASPNNNRKIKSLLDNYTSKPPEDRNPLIFLKAAQRFLLKHDCSETAQVDENNNDDQDQEN
ncbi:hypothetical protein DdX_20172 [Ditylenchus destructor]|uniref:Uncharacterized protein n=1 Tax=Ditylenchus destructor TaxID=166010 RepID=A0AAD4QTS3_9BILA|nr:hypothetical protein DdX_20172 [Ditylenchus destructor]